MPAVSARSSGRSFARTKAVVHANSMLNHCLRGLALILLALAVLVGAGAWAQVPAEAPAADEPAEPELPPDPLNRRTPQGLVVGLLEALADEDYQRAAQYLDLSVLPASRREARGPLLARQLQGILDRGGVVASHRQLSDAPEGRLDDELPPNRDRIATVRTVEDTVELLAERVEREQTGPIWLISAETVGMIPELAVEVQIGLIDRLLPAELSGGPRIGGVPLGHWLVLLVLAALAYVTAWVVIGVLAFLILRLKGLDRHPHARELIRRGKLPLQFMLAVWIFSTVGLALGVSIVARQYFAVLTEVVIWVALAWLIWRILDTAGAVSMDRMSRRGQLTAFSAVRFFRRSAKIGLSIVAGIAVLDTLGFDVTAGLAALGIGGLALALGAQRTVENFVGSLTLIADRPVRVGDYCRIGDVSGTVEDIGMRSTRIRTLDRTLITVPNGELMSLQIENFAHRDQFWFHPQLPLRFGTTPDQIRYLLVEIRSMLYGHPRIDPDVARVRFLGLGKDALLIDIFSYINAEGYDDFLEIQEDLMLRIMDIVAKSGTAFALPSQTLYMARDPGTSSERAEAAEAQVRDWVAQEDLQLPRFRPERIEALRNTVVYPPKGSASRAKKQSPHSK